MTEQRENNDVCEANVASEAVQEKMKLTCPGCQSHLDVTDLEPFAVFACPQCGISIKVPKRWQQFALEDCLSSSHGVECYRALDTALDREVMVELIPSQGVYTDEQLKAYQDVIRRLAAIVDSSLGVIYSCGQYEDCVYSVSQYLPSCLGDVKETLPWRESRATMLALLELLRKAYALGIVHGRINLQTLRMSESRNIRLTGFGMGMVLDNSLEFDGYTSPERVCGAVASITGDIYSLGRVFWHCLAGHLPEEGGTLPEVVPGTVQDLLKRMMSLSPSDRPQGYEEIIAVVKASPEEGESSVSKKKGSGMGNGKNLRLNGTHEGKKGGYVPQMAPLPSKGGHGVLYFMLFLLIVGLGIAIVLVLKKRETAQVRPSATVGETAVPSAVVAGDKAKQGADASKNVEEEDEDSAVEAAPVKKIDASQDAMQKKQWKPLPDELRDMRPKPKNPLVLKSNKVRKYLEALPDEYRHGVEIQAKVLDSLPDVLMFYAKKNKYDRGADTILQLRKPSRKINACITMANDNGMRVKNLNPEQKNVPEHVTFDDLSRRTIMDMLDYYCDYSRQRLDPKDQEYPQQRRMLLKHYFALVMLADWYNEREAAQKYVNLCKELQPDNTKRLDIFEKYGYSTKAASSGK